MAFNINPGKQQFSATASQTVFTFNFAIFADTDLKVYKTLAGAVADDTADLLTLSTHYTVSINGTLGGTVTLLSGASLNDTITLVRVLPVTRSTDYVTNGDLYADTLDLDQDYQTYLVQDGYVQLNRAIVIPESSSNVDLAIPSPIGNAYLRWNDTADALENDTSIPDDVVTSTANATTATTQAGIATTQAVLASTSATNAQLKAWEAEAEKMTADSYATEAEDVLVKIYTSDGDGTFTATDSTDYSSYHWSRKSVSSSEGTYGTTTADFTVNLASLPDTIAISYSMNNITSFGSSVAGATRRLIFEAGILIVDIPAHINLPSNANIVTSNGDVMVVVCQGGTIWQCVSYEVAFISPVEIGYLNNVTSNIQTQLNGKQATLTIDATPTNGSTNPIQSNAVFDGLALKLDLAGGTMTGAITALRETKVAMGANDIALASGNIFTKTISGATTLTVSGWLASGNANSFILELTNGGSAVVTYPAGIKWAGGTAPTLTASGVDILGFYSHDGGTTIRGIVLAKDSK